MVVYGYSLVSTVIHGDISGPKLGRYYALRRRHEVNHELLLVILIVSFQQMKRMVERSHPNIV